MVLLGSSLNQIEVTGFMKIKNCKLGLLKQIEFEPQSFLINEPKGLHYNLKSNQTVGAIGFEVVLIDLVAANTNI